MVSAEWNGSASQVTLDDLHRLPDLVAHLVRDGARLTRVEPVSATLEELYFEMQRIHREANLNWDQVRTVASDRPAPLFKSKDYWIPLMVLGGVFFVVIPFIVLSRCDPIANNDRSSNRSASCSGTCPDQLHEDVGPVDTPGRAGGVHALPSTCSPPSPSSCRSRSRPPSAHTPSSENVNGAPASSSPIPRSSTREIYDGKLIASLVPGYLATLVGFSLYSLVVNVNVGPEMGGWFFPTAGWWILILWVVPPFIAVAISIVLRMSARMRSAAAAQQSSSLVTLPVILLSYAVVARVTSTPGSPALLIGAVAWVVAILLSIRGAGKLKRESLLGVAAET